MNKYNEEAYEKEEIGIDDVEEEDSYEDIMTIYKLPENEIAIANAFVGVIRSIIETDYDKKHLAAFLKYVSRPIYEMKESIESSKNEIENQKTDLEHKLSFSEVDSQEYNATLRAIGDSILERRRVKDMGSIIAVISTNLNRSGNFILSMNKRQYTPRSEKYKKDDICPPKQTTVNTTTMKIDGRYKK